MYRVVGFLVVTSLAIYGAANFIARHIVVRKKAEPAAE